MVLNPTVGNRITLFARTAIRVGIPVIIVAAIGVLKNADTQIERFIGRPGLVTDELLGMTIANYIAGARGFFEFVRFDQAKPGILKQLGSITNDAVGGLVAGCSSNMYSQATRQSAR
jgi:phosphatidylglycerophosphatase A